MKLYNYHIQNAHHTIALLEEYRTRLIADVVTGKLDVREAAARLPDDEEEAKPDHASAEEDPNVSEAEVAPESENAGV